VYDIPLEALLSAHIEQNMARMNTNSSPGFDPFPTLFIKRAETELMDGQGKALRANVLLSLLTDLFKLLLWPKKTLNHTHPQES